jgi:hypothetical protein
VIIIAQRWNIAPGWNIFDLAWTFLDSACASRTSDVVLCFMRLEDASVFTPGPVENNKWIVFTGGELHEDIAQHEIICDPRNVTHVARILEILHGRV